MASLSLNSSVKTASPKIVCTSKIAIDVDDCNKILNILPESIKVSLSKSANAFGLSRLWDIALDIGMNPSAFIGRTPVFFSETPVTVEERNFIALKVTNFRSDNRAEVQCTLHCVSAIRNSVNEIKGLTIRMGRTIKNVGDFSLDLITQPKTLVLLIDPLEL